MSDIIKARVMVADVADALGRLNELALAGRLRAALRLMYREPHARPRAPDQSEKVDARTAEVMRRYARRHPDLTLQTIGERFGVSGGRVTEALQGRR